MYRIAVYQNRFGVAVRDGVAGGGKGEVGAEYLITLLDS